MPRSIPPTDSSASSSNQTPDDQQAMRDLINMYYPVVNTLGGGNIPDALDKMGSYMKDLTTLGQGGGLSGGAKTQKDIQQLNDLYVGISNNPSLQTPEIMYGFGLALAKIAGDLDAPTPLPPLPPLPLKSSE